MRVLIVDDEEFLTSAFERLLNQAGHEARGATTCEEATELARQLCPELVLVDIGLAQMNGYALAHTLRRQCGLASARIVALSGSPPDEQLARAAGIDLHLMKPMRFQALLDIIGKLEANAARKSVSA